MTRGPVRPTSPEKGTFDDFLGIRYRELTSERVVADLIVLPDHLGPGGLVHGGVLSALAEATASSGTSFGLRDSGSKASGMTNSTSFMGGGVVGGRLIATAERLAASDGVWTWSVKVTLEDGDLCAVGKLEIAVIPDRPSLRD
jgi:uncharacterized protein (TIGR00369 family)